MKKTLPTFDLEKVFFNKELTVAGVDEAGRGCLAGPVVAAAVILQQDFKNDIGINDSKQLSAKKRDIFFDVIKESAVSIGIGLIDNTIIDDINILQATQLAMHQAIEELDTKPSQLLIDGNYFKSNGIPFKTVVRGDAISLSIAAASIIAKVTRDRWMIEWAESNYAGYGFAKHKGYGTKVHYLALEEYGICPIHRKSFLKKLLIEEPSLF